MAKILVATEKPFAAVAVKGIREVIEGAGMELALLEKYTDKAQLLEAVKDADALIIRSDKVDNEVLDAVLWQLLSWIWRRRHSFLMVCVLYGLWLSGFVLP